jgi:hypothetical protein
MLKNSRGVSNIGCFLTLAILVAGFYTGYKFAVVQWNLESFKEKLTDATRFWATESTLDNIATAKADIIRRAELCGFTLENDDISISTEGIYVTITVSWQEPILFPGGYEYKRDMTVARSIRKRGY